MKVQFSGVQLCKTVIEALRYEGQHPGKSMVKVVLSEPDTYKGYQCLVFHEMDGSDDYRTAESYRAENRKKVNELQENVRRFPQEGWGEVLKAYYLFANSQWLALAKRAELRNPANAEATG